MSSSFIVTLVSLITDCIASCDEDLIQIRVNVYILLSQEGY